MLSTNNNNNNSNNNNNTFQLGLVRWSLKRGGRLREVVPQGGSTVFFRLIILNDTTISQVCNLFSTPTPPHHPWWKKAVLSFPLNVVVVVVVLVAPKCLSCMLINWNKIYHRGCIWHGNTLTGNRLAVKWLCIVVLAEGRNQIPGKRH